MASDLYIAEKPSVAKAIAEALGGSLKPERGPGGALYYQAPNAHIVPLRGHVLELYEPDEYDPALISWSDQHLPWLVTDWKMRVKAKRDDKGVIVRKAPGQVVLDPEMVAIVETIRQLSKKAERLFHAGDPDREGQSIVDGVIAETRWAGEVLRILPNATGKEAMGRILKDVRSNSDPVFRGQSLAAEARRRADQLVGVNFTRAATFQNRKRGLNGLISVGRVQTPLVMIVYQRCEQIAKHESTPFMKLKATFKHGDSLFETAWKPPANQPGLDKENRLTDKDVARRIQAAVAGKTASVEKFDVVDCEAAQPLGLDLGALQKAASRKYGMTAMQTLELAQSLYEKHKVSSYPRTDTKHLHEDHHALAPGVLKRLKGVSPTLDRLLDQADPTIKSPTWNTLKAPVHHGIVPTGEGAQLSALSRDEMKVFEIIVTQYVAQFFPSHKYSQTTVVVNAAGHRFTASGRTPVRLGWREVISSDADKPKGKAGAGEDDDGANEQKLPAMKAGESVLCAKFTVTESKTKPPPYYKEDTLLAAMEKVHTTVADPVLAKKLENIGGLGTPATQASMIETIKKRQYVEVKNGGEFHMTPAGTAYIQSVPKEISDPATTAMWESLFEKIEAHTLSVEKFMEGQRGFVEKLTRRILATDFNVVVGLTSAKVTEAVKAAAGQPCPTCKAGQMTLRQAKKGTNAGKYFLACSVLECKHTAEIEGQDDPKSPAGKGKTGSRGGATGKKRD